MFRMIARYQPFSPTVTRKPDAAGRSVWKLETRPAAISIGDSPKVATSAGLKVCYRKLPGKHMLFLSFTCFDPKAALRGGRLERRGRVRSRRFWLGKMLLFPELNDEGEG